MATTGTYNFDPTLGDIIEDAFERIGIAPNDINAQHIRSATRSLNLKLASLGSYLEPQLMIENEYTTVAMTAGQEFFTLPAYAFDVLVMVLERDGVRTRVDRMARDDYREQARLDLVGRPSSYFLERRSDGIRVYPYFRPSAGEVFILDIMRKPQDAGDMGNTMELPVHWMEAVISTLCEPLAEKYRPDLLNQKIALAKRARMRAKNHERASGDVRLKMKK